VVLPAGVIVNFAWNLAEQQSKQIGFSGVAYYTRRAIAEGIPPIYGEPWYGGVLASPIPTGEWVSAMAFVLQAWLGKVYAHPAIIPYKLDSSQPSDAEGRFCRRVIDYLWEHPHQSMDYPQVYADSEDVKDWIKVCRKQYQLLGDEERGLLQKYHDSGDIPFDVLIPPSHDDGVKAQVIRESRSRSSTEWNTTSVSHEELVQLLRQSMNSGDSVFPFAEEVLQQGIEYYRKLNLRHVKRIPSDWKEIKKAVVNSEIATFDATPLLSKELLNITAAEIARGEGEAATRIPTWGQWSVPSTLGRFAQSIQDRENGQKNRPRRIPIFQHQTISELLFAVS